MNKIVIFSAALLIGLSSCINPRRITVCDPVEYEVETASKLTLSCGILNCTARKLSLQSGRFKLYLGSSDYATILLPGGVIVPRCSRSEVVIPLRIRFADPLMMLSASTMDSIPVDRLTVSGQAVVKAGVFRKKIELEGVPLSQIISIFESGGGNIRPRTITQ